MKDPLLRPTAVRQTLTKGSILVLYSFLRLMVTDLSDAQKSSIKFPGEPFGGSRSGDFAPGIHRHFELNGANVKGVSKGDSAPYICHYFHSLPRGIFNHQKYHQISKTHLATVISSIKTHLPKQNGSFLSRKYPAF